MFPKEPLIRIEGPLAIAQLLETTLLNLINFPSLVATNAARMRLAAGDSKKLLEFGLRRAQGPDGGISASKYIYIGGFDGTSNVLAGKMFGIDVKGTHAHSFVMCYSSLKELKTNFIKNKNGESFNFVDIVLQKRVELGFTETNEGELAAFISYAQSFPEGFLALVDTYDSIQSGAKNYICVGWALYEVGFKPIGIRLDSGDLSYLSTEIRKMFVEVDEKYNLGSLFTRSNIVARNDINEEVLIALSRQQHEIDTFGIGTHLVTCQKQPALGCVYKLVEVNGKARIKLSQEMKKLVIPGKKAVYRLFGSNGVPLLDLMQRSGEIPPQVGERILVRHPFVENKRAHVTPYKVIELQNLVFDGKEKGFYNGILNQIQSLDESRNICKSQLESLRYDHKRNLNPTPYKISVSEELYNFMHKIWLDEAPIADLN